MQDPALRRTAQAARDWFGKTSETGPTAAEFGTEAGIVIAGVRADGGRDHDNPARRGRHQIHQRKPSRTGRPPRGTAFAQIDKRRSHPSAAP